MSFYDYWIEYRDISHHTINNNNTQRQANINVIYINKNNNDRSLHNNIITTILDYYHQHHLIHRDIIE